MSQRISGTHLQGCHLGIAAGRRLACREQLRAQIGTGLLEGTHLERWKDKPPASGKGLDNACQEQLNLGQGAGALPLPAVFGFAQLPASGSL